MTIAATALFGCCTDPDESEPSSTVQSIHGPPSDGTGTQHYKRTSSSVSHLRDSSDNSHDQDHDEEPEDILSAYLGIVYNYTPITHSEAGSTFTYTYTGPSGRASGDGVTLDGHEVYRWESDPIKLTLHTPDTQARHWQLHASSIWAASVFLADHIGELGLETFLLQSSFRDGQSSELGDRFDVLELGAGAGLPGLLVAKYLERLELDVEMMGKKPKPKNWMVTLSDYPDDLLIETLRGNVLRNGLDNLDHSKTSTVSGNRIRVAPYAWGEDCSALIPLHNEEDGARCFDLIIAADTLWNAALHNVFARTLYSLLQRTPDARIHLVAGLHTGRYALSGFLRAIRSLRPPLENDSHLENASMSRLDVLSIAEREVNGTARREWSEERKCEDDVERRRWVVWIVLGWTDL